MCLTPLSPSPTQTVFVWGCGGVGGGVIGEETCTEKPKSGTIVSRGRWVIGECSVCIPAKIPKPDILKTPNSLPEGNYSPVSALQPRSRASHSFVRETLPKEASGPRVSSVLVTRDLHPEDFQRKQKSSSLSEAAPRVGCSLSL